MANTIALAKKYIDLLDEVYMNSALSVDLESDASLARAGANTNEIVIPKMNTPGSRHYSRSTGYVAGDMTLSWETVLFKFDRLAGNSASTPLDNEETINLAFGRLAGEFLRTKVVPELDAFRFAKYASLAGTSPSGATLSTGDAVIAALRAATSAMDEAEVPMEGRILYITPTLMGLVQDLDTTKSREVLARFSKTVLVPQTRFYTEITQYDGTTAGQEDGGYIKTVSTGKDINFLVAHPSAVLQFTKQAVPKSFSPDQNQDADAWIYNYRSYGLADVFDNKTKAIYLHKKA
jgi:hypothetical protein